MEQEQLYRKSSMDRIQSPEQLNDYLRVTNPSVWVLLTAVILLLVGLLVWGSFIYIDSQAYGTALVADGRIVVRFEDEGAAAQVQSGMRVAVGEVSAEILSLGQDEEGIFALARADLADGTYAAAVRYRQTRLLRLLFN